MERVAVMLAEAHAAGLEVGADGDRLAVRGPKSADAMARRILDRKAEVLAVLAAEAECRALWQEAVNLQATADAVRLYEADEEKAATFEAQRLALLEGAFIEAVDRLAEASGEHEEEQTRKAEEGEAA